MIFIDYKDRRPLYEQVVSKIEELVRIGALTKDEKMPSVRQLASDLAINPNTIQKAYQELERRGIIYSVKGRGNFVSSHTEDIKLTHIGEIYKQIHDSAVELISLGETIENLEKSFATIVSSIKEEGKHD